MKKRRTALAWQEHMGLFSGVALVLLLAIYPSGRLLAQPSDKPSIFDYLNSQGRVIRLALRTDMDELINNRRRPDEEAQPAVLAHTTAEGTEVQFNLEVIPRGKYRRRICDFPPIFLNFSKSSLEKRGMNGKYDKIKLVSYCLQDEAAESYLLKEYLAYKIYNLLAPRSYKVQLARMVYEDSEGEYADKEQYGILIEDTDEMAHRIGGVECEDCLNRPPDSIALEDEARMAAFLYMIGNEDWSWKMLRNIKMVRPYSGGKLIPVPYDFDFSGLVNASYAVPDADFGLKAVIERRYMGFPVSEAMLSKTLNTFELRRSAIQELIKNFEELKKADRMKAWRYINSFYRKKVQKQLAEEALKPSAGPAEGQ